MTMWINPFSRARSARGRIGRCRSAIAAERSLVSGDSRGHAQCRVAVVARGAQAEAHELAQRVELLGYELAGADHADRVRTVFRLDVAERRRHRVERGRPADPLER